MYPVTREFTVVRCPRYSPPCDETFDLSFNAGAARDPGPSCRLHPVLISYPTLGLPDAGRLARSECMESDRKQEQRLEEGDEELLRCYGSWQQLISK